MKKYETAFIIVFAIFAIASLTRGLRAHDTKPEPCPDVTVFGPTSELKKNEIGEYSAVIDSRGVYRETRFEWLAVGGQIVEGQATSKVKVKRTDNDYHVFIRIHGLRPRCNNEFGEIKPDLTPPEAIMLDRIVGPIDDSHDEIIKRFVQATRTDRKSIFWVIVGFKKEGGANGAKLRRLALLDSFNKAGRIGHDSRMTFIDFESDGDFVEFWKTTANARPPTLDK